MADITTIKLSTKTRDRLLEVAKQDFGGASMEKVMDALMDEHWKATCIAQSDAWRRDHPEEWQEYLRENEMWDRLSPNITEMEGPYRSDDPYWLEAGGLPLSTGKDAA